MPHIKGETMDLFIATNKRGDNRFFMPQIKGEIIDCLVPQIKGEIMNLFIATNKRGDNGFVYCHK